MVYYIAFAIAVYFRIMIRVYLICKWMNKKIDPSYIESKLRFYQFFSLGLAEFCTQILGIHLLLHEMREKDERDYSYNYFEKQQKDVLIYLNIYGGVIFTIYLCKLIWILGLYLYFWYHGGLKKVESDSEFDASIKPTDYHKDSLLLKQTTKGQLDEINHLIEKGTAPEFAVDLFDDEQIPNNGSIVSSNFAFAPANSVSTEENKA